MSAAPGVGPRPSGVSGTRFGRAAMEGARRRGYTRLLIVRGFNGWGLLMETTTVCIVVTLPGSPEEVFALLTDSASHSELTGAESRIDARVGGSFSYFGGAVSGSFEELQDNTLLVQRLRAAAWPGGHHATVRQELSGTAEDTRTHIKVIESGVPAEHLDEVVEGWQGYWDAFARYLRDRRVDVVQRFVADYKNRQNPDAVDEFVASDCVLHLPIPGLPQGREGMRINGRTVCAAFPDVRAERKFFVTEGDIVVERAEVTATHEGDLMGIEATGKPVSWTELHAYRVARGQISEVWSEADLMRVMVQIGAVTLPG